MGRDVRRSRLTYTSWTKVGQRRHVSTARPLTHWHELRVLSICHCARQTWSVSRDKETGDIDDKDRSQTFCILGGPGVCSHYRMAACVCRLRSLGGFGLGQPAHHGHPINDVRHGRLSILGGDLEVGSRARFRDCRRPRRICHRRASV